MQLTCRREEVRTADQATRPRPNTAPDPTAPAFVGRSDLRDAMVDAIRDGSVLVLIEGEPGIGKSRLVREVLDVDVVARQRTLLAACPPLSEPFPLGTLVDGVRRLSRALARADGRDGWLGRLGLSRLGGALRPLFPEWAEELPPPLESLNDPHQTRHRLFRAITELIEQLEVQLLVIEDAQWADSATLEWLLTVTSLPCELSVVLTYRPTDVPPGSLLPRLTSRHAGGVRHQRITVGPLDVDATRRLIGSMLRTDEVSLEFATFVHEHVGGVPLAIEESLHLLRGRRDIVRQNGRWARRAFTALAVPPLIRDSVLERVGRLGAPAQRVLQAAAVLNEPAEVDLISAVAGLDDTATGSAIHEAIAAGLLRDVPPGLLAIRHSLDATAIGETIVGLDRVRMNEKAASTLELRDHPPVARLCRHLLEGGDVTGWSRHAEQAADLALEAGDDHAAISVLHRLLGAVEHPPGERARLARRLGQITVHRSESLGRLELAVRDTLAEVVAEPDLSATDRGEIRLLLGWMMFQAADFRAAHEHLQVAVEELEGSPASAARAMMFLARPELPPEWTVHQRRTSLERATALIPLVDAPTDRRALQIERALRLLDLGDEAGWQAAALIPPAAPTALEEYDVTRGLLNVAQRAIDWGRYAEARTRLAEVGAVAEANRFERASLFAAFDIALLDFLTGHWKELPDQFARIEESPDTHPQILLSARAIGAALELRAGRREPAHERLSTVIVEDIASPAALPAMLAAEAIGRLYLLDGEPAQ
ncbi:ATP-binding protein, partial [Isoptericola hypogeus]|uniref:ATP-binding protein n=1 Tax=Isoptericola hypogeus TaxID=300179 RepID=UPI0031E45489